MLLKIKKLTPDAIIPVRAHSTDAGLDLYANEDVVIRPGETKIVKTGIAIQLPPDTVGDVRPRSGLSSKTKLRVANAPGTIDEGFTGEVGVIFDNIRKKKKKKDWMVETIDKGIYLMVEKDVPKGSYIIRKGDKIAQLVILPVLKPEIVEVDSLDDSERGAGGFGSTDV